MATEVKICGIRTRDALEACMAAGADYFGLVLHAASPRNVNVEVAAELATLARNSGLIRSVVLLVDPSDELLECAVHDIAPDYLQLHGRESVERVREVRARWRLPIIKAVSVASDDDAVRGAAMYYEPGVLADIVLFDAKPPKDTLLPGGNGLAFDWRMLDGLAGHMPFALAGGLNPENVAEAIQRTGAAIVDVSSGVERAPGEKSVALIHRFIRAAKPVKDAQATQ